jgi:hypothetical protein
LNKQTIRALHFRAVALVGLALILFWLVISRTFIAHLAAIAPSAALKLSPTNPTALLKLADNSLNLRSAPENAMTAGMMASDRAIHANADATVNTSGPIAGTNSEPVGPSGLADRSQSSAAATEAGDQIRAWAELALLNDPLNARAFRILGLLADIGADEARAAMLMQAAAHRSIRESAAVYWLMRKSLDKLQYAPAIHYADVLLRTRRRFAMHVMPTLARMAENQEASSELKKLLVNNPPWRGQFFSILLSNISYARTPLDLLLSIKETPTPPTAEDIRLYLNFLIGHKFYDLAYYTWLQFLPREQLSSAGFLFNGSFEIASSEMPFDWVIAPGAGTTIDIAARPDQEGRALFMEFGPGRVDFRGVTQLIMLSPGTYRLKGKYKGEIQGPRGLEWRVTCAGGRLTSIGKSPMVIGMTTAWKEFEFSFTVPDADCRAQHLGLELAARSASEQLISGSLWYDELRISRTSDGENPT